MTISSSSRRWAALPILLLALAWPAASQAAPEILAPHLAVRTAASGLNQPIAVAHIGFNDMLVTEKASGQVKRVVNGVVQSTVLDLAVNSASERGLLGIALHPDFPSNPASISSGRRALDRADTQTRSPTSAARQPRRSFVWNGIDLTLRAQHHPPALVPGRRRPAASRQPQRRRDPLRAGWQALHHHRRQRPPRLDAEPGERAVRPGYSGRPVRRAAAGQRPPHRRDPAPQRRRHDARGQSVLPARPPIGGEVGANIQKIFAYGFRNSFGMAFDPAHRRSVDAGERRRHLHEINRVSAGQNGGWVQIMGPVRRGRGVQGDRDRAPRSSASSRSAGRRRTSPTRRRGAVASLHVPRARTTAIPSSAGSSRSRPAGSGF